MNTRISDYIEHFNHNSAEYFQFRPNYPDVLFQYIIGLTAQQTCAWDVGTGNGQAAVALSHYFKTVIAKI